MNCTGCGCNPCQCLLEAGPSIDTSVTDYKIALDLLGRLVGPDVMPGVTVFFRVDGDPKSKGRARFTRKGIAYTPKATAISQANMTAHFVRALKGRKFAAPVAIVAVFFRPNYQRIDSDNMMKLVLDAGTKAGAWVDDCYITAQAGYIEFDAENPRTLVIVAPTTSTLNRSVRFVCCVCGKPFNRAGVAAQKHPPKFCSRDCRHQGYVRDRAQARCAKCGIEFARKAAGQRYCSKACASASRMPRPPGAELRPWPACEGCGKPVSRREYRRCSACSPKGRRLGSKNKPKGDQMALPVTVRPAE